MTRKPTASPRPPDPLAFFGALKWLDGTPLDRQIESYRQRLFRKALFDLDAHGIPRINLVLAGRAKKNWKSADLVLAALYRLLAWRSPGGNQCYILANDEGQAADDLEIAKKLAGVNPLLGDAVTVRAKGIERRDGRGSLEILPAKDIAGSHGKTYLFCGFDEIHEYRDYALLEALQPDPTRPDALMWITSYASLYHKPGAPLFDLFTAGKRGTDARMLFSWYAADYVTDPAFTSRSPEEKANPSLARFAPGYLDQQRSRLPAHKYRRLHLNLPGLPEGSAYTAERVMDAIARGVTVRPYQSGLRYVAFVDMSGGSDDDAVLAIGHADAEGRAVLDRLVNQGRKPPFDPDAAVARFVSVLQEYRITKVTGDSYAGQTFKAAFTKRGISYTVAAHPKTQLYEALEPHLNGGKVVLLDHPECESQLLSLMWRGSKIDHPAGEHDDFANAAAGVVQGLLTTKAGPRVRRFGEVAEAQREAAELTPAKVLSGGAAYLDQRLRRFFED